jgi:hypothetical protein
MGDVCVRLGDTLVMNYNTESFVHFRYELDHGEIISWAREISLMAWNNHDAQHLQSIASRVL